MRAIHHLGLFGVFLIFVGRIMPCGRGTINRCIGAGGRAEARPKAAMGSASSQKLPFSCTNRLRASQIAASMLVDFETVDIR
jgi:hypothetical protein